MDGKIKAVFCNRCGWCHFAVSPEDVLAWVAQWRELFKTKPKDWLETYGITDKPPSAADEYYKCHRCGNSYKDFTRVGKVPFGSTISGILDPTAEIPTDDNKE